MPRYDAVLIDLDETLFDFRRAGHEALEASFQVAGLALSDEWYRLYYATNAELWREVEEGRTSVTALRVERFRRYFSRLGLAIEPAAFAAGYEQRILSVTYHIEGAVEAVREIAGMAQVVVLTNGISHVQRARINRSPIAHLIRAVIVSEEADLLKEAEKLAEDIINEDNAHKSSGLSRNAYGILKILEAYRLGEPGTGSGGSLAVAETPHAWQPGPLQRLAMEIDSIYASEETAPIGWHLKEQLRKELRQQVRGLAFEADLDCEQVPTEVEKFALKHYIRVG